MRHCLNTRLNSPRVSSAAGIGFSVLMPPMVHLILPVNLMARFLIPTLGLRRAADKIQPMNPHLTLINSPTPERAQGLQLFPCLPFATEGDFTGVHGIAAPFRLEDLTNGELGDNRPQHHRQWVIWDGSIDPALLPKTVKRRTGTVNFGAEEFSIADNRLRILACHLEGPELINKNGFTQLQMQPVFELDYQAEQFPAQIAEMRLVASQRFLNLQSGTSHVFTHTDENTTPAVVVGARKSCDSDDRLLIQIFAPLLWQEHKKLRADTPIYQTIFDEFNAEPVASVTVLEQYTSYFVQRYYGPTQTGCWVPAAPPVTWGWSIRVAKNGADEWAIVRRKLMLPTVGHEGLQLPHWHNQLIACEQGYTA